MKYKLEKIFLENDIKNITFDSRNIKPGDAFFAIKGEKFDGNAYIDSALLQGASIVFTDDDSRAVSDKVLYVENARKSLSIASSIFYPKVPENIIAVTGTNGKSSVVSYVHQILSLLGKKSAVMGTLGIESTEKLPSSFSKKGSLTTSDPISFRSNLQTIADSGVDNIAFEASSHGLDQYRMGEVLADSAAFVSFSQDHLEYHETMDKYLHAKLRLFTEHLKPGSEAVINSEIMYFDKIQKFLEKNNITYSTVGLHGDLKIISCMQSINVQDISFEYKENKYSFRTSIIGSFQATNILIAAKLVYNLGYDFNEIVGCLSRLQSVSGRLQRITEEGARYHVFVDYAHTPDALEKSLIELKNIKENSAAKLYVIFGCGGDRDRSKRPIMGRVASSIADQVIITDDNPRTESAAKIRSEVGSGATDYIEIGDRARAIGDIISKLKTDDILLIAGKGHEDYQIIGKEVIELSDIKIAHLCLENSKIDR
ncbi:MAG: UDP-N-acetylmuramoyl-L-alanyl-D-glutamate--2,6-diaminopimelate ligase [Rickettsiaceae bacterium]|nr:UDP-N-acetylmuramoyl-L-alanyl-D-glutamate--2,6-diaminopimelate ligase [Rickettsiaceae bacterium]